MPETVIPIKGLHTVGLVKDSPAVSLPPSAFTDVLNVRFDNGAVNKIPGNRSLVSTRLGLSSNEEIIHLAYWANPNIGPSAFYWIFITNNSSTNRDQIYVIHSSTGSARALGSSVPEGGDWQHTLYQGGYAIILNNGIERPKYVLDATGNTSINSLNIFDLPGWDSYNAQEVIVDDTYDSTLDVPEFDLGRVVDFTLENVIVDIVSATGVRKATSTWEAIGAPHDGDDNDILNRGNLALDTRTNTHTITLHIGEDPYLENGDRVVARIVTLGTVQVRAEVVRAWGDVLVAGGLREVNENDNSIVIRNQPGVVRISDVAAPGSIPSNWNPYAMGVSTAEEFTLASTGIVKEMAELQGNLYVYTDSSIHTIIKTGNPNALYIANTVSNQYGALSRDCVQEFNGKHIVVGSNDIYEFSGHPASINSIASERVQDFFYESLPGGNVDTVFLLLNRAENEIWINYEGASNSESLIWNYKTNTYTFRQIDDFSFGVIGPYIESSGRVNPGVLRPMFCNGREIYGADYSDTFTNSSNSPYNSYVERLQGALTPEFDVETISSVALWADGAGSLDLIFRPTNNPGQTVSNPTLPLTARGPNNATFTVGNDYKSDVRLNGRFMNYRITDGTSTSTSWNISGIQLAVMKGGRR